MCSQLFGYPLWIRKDRSETAKSSSFSFQRNDRLSLAGRKLRKDKEMLCSMENFEALLELTAQFL